MKSDIDLGRKAYVLLMTAFTCLAFAHVIHCPRLLPRLMVGS